MAGTVKWASRRRERTLMSVQRSHLTGPARFGSAERLESRHQLSNVTSLLGADPQVIGARHVHPPHTTMSHALRRTIQGDEREMVSAWSADARCQLSSSCDAPKRTPPSAICRAMTNRALVMSVRSRRARMISSGGWAAGLWPPPNA